MLFRQFFPTTFGIPQSNENGMPRTTIGDIGEHDSWRLKMFKCVVLIAVALAAPATASSIGKAMSGEPDHAFQSGKNLFEIERCIVMADMPDAPSVYRSPDKPNESLIFYPKLMGKGQPVIKLESVGSAVSAKVWHPNGKGMSQNVASCM